MRIVGVLLVLLLLFAFPSCVMAQQVTWSLLWQDDGTIQEKVEVTGTELSGQYDSWTVMSEGSDQISLTRSTEDWEAYSQLNDRLPIRIEAKDYIVMQFTRVDAESFSPDPQGVYAQVAGMPGAVLTFQVPGIVRDHSADVVENSQKAVWDLNRLDHVLAEEQMLTAVTFDGLLIGIILVGGAALIIAVVFLRSILRVNRLIEEEYSLENLQLEPDPDQAGSDEQKI